MTPEAQQIAIAEALGFRAIHRIEIGNQSALSGLLNGKDTWVPDYCGSLDAIMPVVRSNCPDDVYDWMETITAATDETGTINHARIALATAQQWSEAFLRAKGLWR